MKGIKLYALLGSLTVAVACVPPVVLADTPAKPAATDGDQPVFNEMEAGKQSRQLRLDQLFDMPDKPAPAKSAAQKPTASTSFHPPNNSRSVSIPYATAAAKPSPLISKHQAPKTKGTDQSQLAIYKNGSEHAALAVSHAVISNSTTPVIAASLDRPGTLPKYKAGDHMVINLKALQDCNIMVFDYDNKGTITQLYPNDFDHSAALHAGQQVALGGDDSKYTLDVNGGGLEQIFVYAYPTSEKPIEVAMLTPVASSPFRAAHMTRAQYDRLIHQSKDYTFTQSANEDRSVSVQSKSSPKAESTAQVPASVSKVDHDLELAGAVPVNGEKPANKIELIFQIEN